MAHALTAARLLLALPFAAAMAGPEPGHGAWAALLLAAAVVTDVLDGPLARRRGTASATGRLFDHAADALFVVSGLAGAALRGAVPWALPVLVAAAFLQYVIDSYWLDGAGQLRPSRLGRVNGILYFAPLGADVLVRLGLAPLRPWLVGLAWVLVASTVLSMGERLGRSLRARRRGAPASPAGGTRGRPPR